MPREPASSAPDPSPEELAALTQIGRLRRLLDDGLSPAEALAKLMRHETADDYTERNRRSMEAVEARLVSPTYNAKFAAAMAEPDPAKQAAMLADLKRENFATLDLEAVHRVVAARNRQWKAEGILPPDKKV